MFLNSQTSELSKALFFTNFVALGNRLAIAVENNKRATQWPSEVHY